MEYKQYEFTTGNQMVWQPPTLTSHFYNIEKRRRINKPRDNFELFFRLLQKNISVFSLFLFISGNTHVLMFWEDLCLETFIIIKINFFRVIHLCVFPFKNFIPFSSYKVLWSIWVLKMSPVPIVPMKFKNRYTLFK